VSNRLNDEDVDRIAGRVVGKLITYGLVLVVALWLAPILVFGLLAASAQASRGLPWPLPIAITASVIAVPVALLIWIWGRSRRER